MERGEGWWEVKEGEEVERTCDSSQSSSSESATLSVSGFVLESTSCSSARLDCIMSEPDNNNYNSTPALIKIYVITPCLFWWWFMWVGLTWVSTGRVTGSRVTFCEGVVCACVRRSIASLKKSANVLQLRNELQQHKKIINLNSTLLRFTMRSSKTLLYSCSCRN